MHVNAFNAKMLDLIDGAVHTYYSFDSIKEDDCAQTSRGPRAPPEMMEYLAMATESGIPPHELRLKEGCLCSLMRNISVDLGLVKNARLIVWQLLDHVVEVETLSTALTSDQPARFLLPRINFEF